MIPKVIHYCWFGGNKLPELGEQCIASWKKYCPEYQIIEWNETNYDCLQSVYAREAYEEKKWAFISDYARLDIVYRYGGIYLDIDVELVQNLDSVINCSCFLATETTRMIGTGLGFGAEAGNINIKLMLDQYKDIHFKLGKELVDMLPCPHRNTLPFCRMGFEASDRIQYINGAVIYPAEYFCPLDYETKQLNITDNTVSIHHYNASWITEEEIELKKKVNEYRKQHGRIRTIIYKNICEYQMENRRVKISLIVYFFWKKIQRRRNRANQNLKEECRSWQYAESDERKL